MNVLINSQALAQELKLLEKVVNAKATIPILQNVLMIADATAPTIVRLHATDLEVGLMTECAARVLEAGRITLPVKKLLDLVNQLPDGDISIRLDKTHVRLASGVFKSRLQAHTASDFPMLPSVAGETHELSAADLHDMIKQTRFACSDKNVRYFMAGAQLSFTPTVVALVATDGRRVALTTRPRSGTAAETVILPSKVLDLLASLEPSTSGETVAVSFSEQHLFFSYGVRIFCSRTVDGKFPDYQLIIPRSHPYTLDVERAALTAAVKRVSRVSGDNSAIYIALTKDAVHLSAASAEVGDADEQVSASYDGDEMKICLSWQFLLDFLEASINQRVQVKLQDPKTQLLLTDGSTYLNVIMTMTSV